MDDRSLGSVIVETLNYSLFHEIPHCWKICRLHSALKEEGYVSSSPNAFIATVFRFYEKRARSGQSVWFRNLFGINMTGALRDEFALNYSDIEVDSRKTNEVTREVLKLLRKVDATAFQSVTEAFLSAALHRMYAVVHYSKISQFYFSDFERAVLAAAKNTYAHQDLILLKEALENLRPQTDTLDVPLVPSSEQSLTQAELDWLKGVVEEAQSPNDSLFPKLHGTAAKSDADYPEALRPILKSTRMYEVKRERGERIPSEVNEKIRKSIAAKAQEIIDGYQKGGGRNE